MKHSATKTPHAMLGFARKAVIVGASAALTLSCMPATAFAAVNLDNNGNVTYNLPTQPVSIQQTKTDANGNKYTQDYLTVSDAQPPMNQPYYSLVGINNVMLGRTIVKGGATETQYGLFGSDANVNPDTYLYNYCASLNGATVATDAMSMSASSMTVTIDGTEYNMPREIYMEANMLKGKTADGKSGDYTYAEWVKLENQREGRTKTGTYDPAYVKISNNSGSAATMTASLYTTADVCDDLIEASKDANGNYTLATRYAEGPTTHSVVSNYEDIVKGTQYYVLSQIANGTVKKATVAVVCGYDPFTGNYAVRKINTGIAKDYDANVYAGRFSTAICAIANDINDLGLKTAQDAYVNGTTDQSKYLAWYTPEQIVENADAVLVTDAPSSNRVSTYLATASDGKAYGLYNSNENNMAGLVTARSKVAVTGASAADLCYKWPSSLFGVYYAQGCENVVLSLVGECFLYPELLDLTDVMAWWAKNVWHITDASLQDIVDSTCYNISLSYNQSQIHTISADSEERIDAAISAGNAYYLENHEAIDAICGGVIATYSLDELAARALDVTLSQGSYTYNGSAQEPSVTVKAAGKELKEGTDYTVSYENNTNAGTATVVVTGKGDYAASKGACTFTIAKAKNTMTAKAAKASFKAAKKAQTTKITVKKAQGKVTYKSSKAKVKVSKAGKVTIAKGFKGTAKITVKAAGTKNYKAASKTITIKVK